MSKLESEIRHVLHSHQWPLKLAYPRVNYSAWLKNIQPRLEEWYNTVPQPSKAHPSSVFACQAYWEAVYKNAILLLYRPDSIVLHTPIDMMSSFEASCKLITSIKDLQREGKIDVEVCPSPFHGRACSYLWSLALEGDTRSTFRKR